MRIEIWSDVVCPWCYVGKRRLEHALERFEHADEVEVVYRSFELDPTAPQVGHESVVAAVSAKYGVSEADGRRMMGRVSEVAAEEGLTFDYLDATHTKTVDAHRLLHLALGEVGPAQQHALKEALLAAYFTRGESMGDHGVLARAAAEAGLDAERVAQVLEGDEFTDAVHADVEQARAFGASGVPFFVVDRRYGLSGAQPAEVFDQLLRQAWDDAHPQLVTVGSPGADGDACGPDGCAV